MRPDRIFVAPEVDLYAILSVPRDATPDEVWTAYVREAERWHPAHNHTAEARDHFEAINLAYEILRDSEMRGQYDRWMAYERVKARTQVQSQAAPAPTAEVADPPASARWTWVPATSRSLQTRSRLSRAAEICSPAGTSYPSARSRDRALIDSSRASWSSIRRWRALPRNSTTSAGRRPPGGPSSGRG